MNLKQLEALIYVSRHGTFKQAAEALYFDSSGEDYITPESIQYRIKQLESELGVSLYRKRQGSSRVTLTREGQLFLSEALEVYQRMCEWRNMFLDSDRGWLTFATTQAILLHRLTDTVVTFREQNPSMKLRVINAYAGLAEQLVSQGRVDFGLSTRPPEMSDLEYVPWKRGDMKLIVPEGHPLASRDSVPLADLAKYPLVLLEPEIRGDRELVDEGFRKAGVRRPNVVMEVSNSEICAAYVAAGVGVSVICETAMARRRSGIVALPLADSIGKSEAGLLVREGQYIPLRAREFLKLLDPVFEEWLKERDERLEKEAITASATDARANNHSKRGKK